MAHPSKRVTTNMITERFVWPGIKTDYSKWTQQCVQYLSTSKSNKTYQEPTTDDVPDARFQQVHINLIEPLLPAKGNSFCLTCIDRYTSWPEFYSILYIKTKIVAEALLPIGLLVLAFLKKLSQTRLHSLKVVFLLP